MASDPGRGSDHPLLPVLRSVEAAKIGRAHV